MQRPRFLIAATSATLVALALTLPAAGHGGRYVGPGDIPPPGGGGGGDGNPGTPPPAPSGPGGSPPPSGGGSGRPTSSPVGQPNPPGGTGGSRSPGGAELGADLTVWDLWWGYNKEPYLRLRERVHGAPATSSDDFFLGQNQRDAQDSQRPTEAQVRGQVVPALLALLGRPASNDVETAAMIALAKIGDVADEDGASEFVAALVPRLASGSQEVSETAALALGILADARAVPLLLSLVADGPEGRRAVGGKEVPVGTRAFAAYGLGLTASRTPDEELRRHIAARLMDVLDLPHFGRRDVKVAAVSALGLCALEWEPDGSLPENDRDAGPSGRAALVSYLADYADPRRERAEQETRHWFVRTHAMVALGRLLEDGVPAHMGAARARALEVLSRVAGRHSKERRTTQQAAVIALGLLARPSGEDVLDAQDDAALELLVDVARNRPDLQSEAFALIALAQVGGSAAPGEAALARRARLERELLTLLGSARGNKRPWAALALGVYARALLDAGDAVPLAVLTALREEARSDRTPATAGASFVALGLARDEVSRDLLLERLEYFAGSDAPRGYACVGLGLMGARGATAELQELLRASRYRPELLRQTATALGLLGDVAVVPELVEMLGSARGLFSQAGLASALGTIGDARSVAPLVKLALDERQVDLARAFAVVALGIVCERELLPWNARYSVNAPYRASTTTLTNPLSTGVLDIR